MRIDVVLRYVGSVMLFIALFMLLSAVISYVSGVDSSFYPLLLSSLLTALLGVFPLIFVEKTEQITTKEGFCIVVGSWLVACVVGMFPYLIWGGEFSLVNAWFESVSGLTTTGSTVLNDVEALPLPDATDLHDLQYEPFGAWVDPDVRRATGTGLEDIESAMGEWGDGARAQVVVKWNGEDEGHTFVAEQEDGRTLFVDPQDPSVDARAYFGLKNGKPLIEEGSVSFCRTDTLQPSSRIFDACKGRE